MSSISIKKFDTSTVIINIWKNTFYRSIILALLVVSLFAPFYGIHFAMPSFTRELIKMTENEAVKTARHLAPNFSVDQYLAADENKKIIAQALSDFDIYKIKYFASTGEILFSTDTKDIGTINTNDYFREAVAKGNVFTKVVKKGSQSLEGKTMSLDVAEVYVPLMRDLAFEGAFEIYYNITERKQKLDALLKRSSLIAIITSALFFCFSFAILFNASRNNLRQTYLSKQIATLNSTLEQRVHKQTLEIKLNQEITIETLASLAEYYDTDTGGHLERIQLYVNIVAEELKKNSVYAEYVLSKPDYINEVSLAALLHDIGKVAIDKSILMKPGKLSDKEFDLMKEHTSIAGRLLKNANTKFVSQFGKDSYLAFARDIALNHHEKWDGTGYPKGLSGEGIPLSARIVSVVDVYDALRSERPYKDAWSHKKAVDEIYHQRGSQFDPVVVDAFMAISHIFESRTDYS